MDSLTRVHRSILALLLSVFSLIPLVAGGWEIRSGERQGSLIELYTSEGCSSCPPAEKWLSQFRGDPRLWREIIPVAFHVDYWDGLGWPDRFARPAFSERQRERAAVARRSPYTPEIDLNGREWRGYAGRPIPESAREVGVLSARAENGSLEVKFSPSITFRGGQVHAAWLGTGLNTKVRRGENAGRTLTHDFVVLATAVAPLASSGDQWEAQVGGFSPPSEATALAVWVETDLQPVQAVGGWRKPTNP